MTKLPSSLAVTVDGAVAILRLDRAAKRNAIDDVTVEGIGAFFAAPPKGVRAVVVHGAGDHFCAGLDLGTLGELSVAEGIAHSRAWHRAFEHIEFGAVPVVAILHGAVVGGGLELAAACHIRVAEPSSFYALPEGSRGIFVGGGGSVRIPRLIGVARMTDMMLTGRVYSAAEGQQAGISHYLVGADEGLAKGVELAKKIATNTDMTNFAVIQALPRIAESSRDAGFMAEALVASIAQAEPEAKKRMGNFLAKRAAKVQKR
jgi:enoyl-CoA hydratase/carnithine racemase